MGSTPDPRLRALDLDADAESERIAGLRASGLSARALLQVQESTPRWIRFGPVGGFFHFKRLALAAGAVALTLAATFFAWLEADPDTPTRPEGGGYAAAAVFYAGAIALIWARRFFRAGRVDAPRVLVDLEAGTTSTPRGFERFWSDTHWVAFKHHSDTGIADSWTSIEFPIERNWDLFGFECGRPDCRRHSAYESSHHALLKDADLETVMEVVEHLAELGVCDVVDVDPPRDVGGGHREIPVRFGSAFRVLGGPSVVEGPDAEESRS